MRRLLALTLLVFAAGLRADTLIMKSGEKYQLKSPATHKNGIATFTTTANRLFSVKESEIAKEITGPSPTPPKPINRTDSRQLGAIARQQREERGKTAPVAGKSGDSKKDPKKKETHKLPTPPPPSEENR